VRTPEIRIGTSSFSEADWVGPFYPPGTRPTDYFQYYTTQFSTVEIDASYYAVPSVRTVDRWRDLCPPGFILSAKFPRSIVHGGESATPNPAIVLNPHVTYPIRDQFLQSMSRLGPHLGPLVLQFPYFAKAQFGSPDPFMALLDRFLTDLPGDFRYAVEIRNPRWLTPQFADLLRSHNVALVLIDQGWMPMVGELEKLFDPVTADFCYIRLLGDRKEIEAITTSWGKEVIDRSANIDLWADWLARLFELCVKTLVYVNNHYAGHAPATVRRLEQRLQQKLAGNSS
jgi:uncharacterized protein YecE (DUF72 family)